MDERPNNQLKQITMAQQKLYTEEQVREILKSTHIHTDNDVNMILSQFTPIELPSDDEIKEQAVMYSNKWQEYRAGAKWMKEQILNQNK